MMHIPSFFVGSLASGTAFLLVHQQLSHRERLTRKWPLVDRAEHELRTQLKNLRAQISKDDKLIDAGANNEASFGKETVTKYYTQILDHAQNFFGKKD